jgi:predicted phage tail protein
MTAKKKVKLSLDRLSVPDKVNWGSSFKDSVKNDRRYAKHESLIGLSETAILELQAAYMNAQESRSQSMMHTAVLRQKEDAFDQMLTALGMVVEVESGGDEALILSTGASVRSKPGKAGIPKPPEALSATQGADLGMIALKWKKAAGSRSYLIRATTNIADSDSWVQVAVSTRTSAEVPNLDSGKQYWFQVSAVGSAGQGPWSDPATKTAP